MKPTRDYIRAIALEIRTAAVLTPGGVAVWWEMDSGPPLVLPTNSGIARSLLDCMHGPALAACIGVFAAPCSRNEIEEALLAHAEGRLAA